MTYTIQNIVSNLNGGSFLSNGCPAGTSYNTISMDLLLNDNTLKTITFMVCDESGYTTRDTFRLIILISGISIISIMLILALYANLQHKCCNRKVYTRQLDNSEQKYISDNNTIFNKLGYGLHRDFIVGNLTNELMESLKTYEVNDLKLFENYAIIHNKNNIAIYIQKIIDAKEIEEDDAKLISV
jgi:hypothetical protein